MSYKITENVGEVSMTYEGDDVQGLIELYLEVSDKVQPKTIISNNTINNHMTGCDHTIKGNYALDC